MAIVNENVKIVKLLLDHGANVHERCLGSFFLPLDQKDKANGIIRRVLDRSKSYGKRRNLKSASNQVDADGSDFAELDQVDLESNHFSSLNTNYDGLVYYELVTFSHHQTFNSPRMLTTLKLRLLGRIPSIICCLFGPDRLLSSAVGQRCQSKQTRLEWKHFSTHGSHS